MYQASSRLELIMGIKKTLEFLTGQVERAVIETRAALNASAVKMELTGTSACLISIIDKYQFFVDDLDDESGFRLDESKGTITFSAEPVLLVWNESYALASEIGLDDDERLRAQEASLNQFVIHELYHVVQKLWDFSAVPAVKSGLPMIGLAILDLAADIESAWVAAIVESHAAGVSGEDMLKFFVDALLRAYVVGAFVFDSRSAPKRQRAIGLIISLVLVQAQIEGRLLRDQINAEWSPTSPVLAFDLSASHRFNGIILAEHIGLLIQDHDAHDGTLLQRLWDQVGSRPIQEIITLVTIFLRSAGAIR